MRSRLTGELDQGRISREELLGALDDHLFILTMFHPPSYDMVRNGTQLAELPETVQDIVTRLSQEEYGAAIRAVVGELASVQDHRYAAVLRQFQQYDWIIRQAYRMKSAAEESRAAE